MKYVINPTRYEDKVTDIMADEFEILVGGQMRYVIRGISNRVVNGDNTESPVDEAIAQMRSEKSGSAGNHGDLLRRSSFKHTHFIGSRSRTAVVERPRIQRLPWVTSLCRCLQVYFGMLPRSMLGRRLECPLLF